MAPRIQGGQCAFVLELSISLACKATHDDSSILQLCDAIRRATVAHLFADSRNGERFLEGFVVKDSTWGEWEETTFDVRRVHA